MLLNLRKVKHDRFGGMTSAKKGLSIIQFIKKERLRHDSVTTPPDSPTGTSSSPLASLISSSGSASLSSDLPALIRPDPAFVIEEEYEARINPQAAFSFYDLESQSWYREQFHGQPHRVFMGLETPLGTVIICFKEEQASQMYRVLLLTQDGDQKILVPSSSVNVTGYGTSFFKLLNSVNPLLLTTGIVREVVHEELPDALRSLEQRERPQKYKFGLVLVKEGQTDEESIFSNNEGSIDWYEFLGFIGDKIQLKGWSKFAGGLDVKNGHSGESSRYSEWRGNEIMWHVSTMLPQDNTGQQIARKRHIGNDIVLVAFLDGPTVSFSPKTIRSHFIHNIITVRRIPAPSDGGDNRTRYHISVCSKEDVPLFGPMLPKPAIFDKDDNFREFLYCKLINAELASYRTLYFSKRLRPGRRAMLDEVVVKYFPVDDA